MRKSIFVFIFSLLTMAQVERGTAQQSLPDFNKLWNYNKPEETRIKFQEIEPTAKQSDDRSYYLQLLTQIARTYSLQGKFSEAHQTLDVVEKQLQSDLKLARVRYLLERGRTFNSSNQQSKAIPLFLEAAELGEHIGEMRYAIDAVHMVAIAMQDANDQVKWNLKGIAMAEADSTQRGWLNAFYNNIGESYLLLKDYSRAYHYFHSLAELQRATSGNPDIYTIKDVAKTLRLMGKPTEAIGLLTIVLDSSSDESQGWISVEYAESLEATGQHTKAIPYFEKAYSILSADEYFAEHNKEELLRLKKMSQQ